MRRFIIPLVALLAATPAAAQQTQAYHGRAGYTVQLPAEWRRMTDVEMRDARQTAQQAGLPITLEAGYRVTDSATGWPWMAVGAIDVGVTITQEDLAAAIMRGAAHAHAQERVNQMPVGERNPRLDVPTWDAENGIGWARLTVPSEGRASPFNLVAMTLHPNGRTIVEFIYFSAPGEDEGPARAYLLQIVRSLRVD